ncbi:AEC family transporter [Stenoxybacter acetivorans]|uniref:AEC family transporter n=1 Tax=Stenoxybacter acetivorans TaxID=422441 RepID=UPI00055E5F53|nr:AEC family transporter [Stenoxybacter acetivorans]
MLTTFLSVCPIFLLIVCGYFTKNYFLKDEIIWKSIDKLVYYLFFPSLLVLEISESNFTGGTPDAILVTLAATTAVALIIFIVQKIVPVQNDLFTSIFQGGVRYNSYVFIALSQSLFGTQGVALSGVFIAYMIVFTNVISVLVLNHYGNGGKKSLSGMVQSIVKNPLIIGAVLGVVLNMAGIHIGSALKPFLGYLGNAATPLSLMSVGGGLMLKMHSHKTFAAAYAVTLKLIVMPLIAVVLLNAFNVSGIPAYVALLYTAVPCAGNAYILSRQMGGDSETMASVITWTTLVSVISITLIMGNIPILLNQ